MQRCSMARRKKKEKLTLEEKLERALVPAEEQPYEVPENWCWSKLEFLTDIKTGKKDANYGCEEGEYYFFTCASEPIRCSGYSFDGKAILIAGNGDISNISLYNGKFEAYQRTYVLEQCRGVTEEYLYYYFKYRWVDYNKDKMFGTAIPYIRLGNLKEYEIPIPPMLEQQCIVERIESLFAKLDEAKEKVMEVKESYLAQRATVLSLAFNGKLTSKWRSQNNIGNSWNKKTFSEVAVVKSNLVQPSEYQDFPHIAPDNIEKRTGVLLHYNTIAEDKVTSGKHRFYPGQILYSKIRPYLSKVVMVDFDGLCSADMYPIEAKENTKYLWYYMLSDDFLEQASSAGSRSVLPKINQKELSKLYVNIPDIDEQEEVVKILDKILPYEQKAAEHMETILEQIDMMKKFILSKAFQGKLGTNNPEEGSAIEELKTLLMKM